MTDQPGSGAEAPAQKKPRKRSRRKWYLLALALIFIVIAIGYGLYYFLVAQFYASTDDAYVNGNRIQLTPQIQGTVAAIHADDTDRVNAGDTVVALDPTDAENALAQAKAHLAETVREVRQLYAQLDTQKSTIAASRSTLTQARLDYQRDQHLIKVSGVSRQVLQRDRSTYHADAAKLAAAKHRLAELEAQTAGTTLRAHPRVKRAEANLRDAYLNVRRTHIIAPVSGYVAQRNVQLGQRIDPSKPLLSIVPIKQTWVDANFKETQLASMRIGQPATVTSDFYGSNVVYHGHVAGISPGTGAAFELLPPQNATGNWIKIVRRVPVRIVLDPKDLKKHPLRLGLSMEVTVDLHDTSGQRLARLPPKKPRYATAVYQRRLAGAQHLIHQVVDANDGKPNTPVRTSAPHKNHHKHETISSNRHASHS
jgi:membrane fusion protein (multidrug efflux system)